MPPTQLDGKWISISCSVRPLHVQISCLDKARGAVPQLTAWHQSCRPVTACDGNEGICLGLEDSGRGDSGVS